MTGLEKMIDQILEDASNSAGEKLKDARAQAEEILNTAREEAEREAKELAEKGKLDAANYEERMKSSSDLKRRTAILQAKQELIAGILEKAYQKFCAQEDEAYFSTLLDMLEKFAMDQDGIIYFSDEDLKKLPEDFARKASQVAAGKGGTIAVSSETRNIGKGFVLAYGDVEENCSFQALFESRKDELQDQVQAILFS